MKVSPKAIEIRTSFMKITSAVAAFLALLAMPAWADKKVDDAVAKANEQLLKGKPEEAQKTMQKLVSGTPTAEAFLALVHFQQKLGNLDEAEAALAQAEQAAGAAPPTLKAHILATRAELTLRRGAAKAALQHAQEAVKLDANPENLAVLARAQARVFDLAGALQTADKAVQAGPASAAAHEARGLALLVLSRFDEAVAAYRKALELDPKFIRARVGLARALEFQGKPAEAVAEARKASEADQKSAEAFAELGSAILAENVNNWNDAIAQAQQGAFLDPKSPFVQTTVGDIFAVAGNYDQAAGAYRKALESDPSYVRASLGLAQMLARKGDNEGATAAAKKVVQDIPHSPEANLLLGTLLLRRKEFDAAVEPLEKATAQGGSVAEAYAFLGTAYQWTRRSPEAFAAYQRAVELDPKNLDYQTTYGLMQGMTGDYEAGAETLKKVIATAAGQKNAAAWANLGWVYSRMKPPRTEESLSAYRKALELDPKNAQIHIGIAWAHYYNRAWGEGVAEFKKAAELEPKLASEAYNGMAWCHYFKKDMPGARAAMEKAQAGGRNDPRLRSNIEKIEAILARGGRQEEQEEPQDVEQGPDLNALNRALQSKNPAVRRGAATEVRKAGREAVPYLRYALADAEIGVRLAALRSLVAIGSASCELMPDLQQVLRIQPDIPTTATPQELQRMVEWADYQKSVREAIQKMGCR